MRPLGVPAMGTIPIIPDLEGRRVLVTGAASLCDYILTLFVELITCWACRVMK